MKTIFKIIPVCFGLIFYSCKKDTIEPEPIPEPTPSENSGKLKIEFAHFFENAVFNLNQKYKNANGDTVEINKLKYYISNIVVTKNDNTTFSETESYHLIDMSNPSSTLLTLTSVPFASYKSISFMLGVDSTRNVSGAQSGALAPSDMFWNWNTGYIMFKMEGVSPQSGSATKSLTYHIGGFSGINKAQRMFSFNFLGNTANVTSDIIPVIKLSADINEFFKNPNLINVSTQYFQMSAGANAKLFADNYSDMITFKSVQN